MGKNLIVKMTIPSTNQNDQLNVHYFAKQKDHPNHTEHVKIDLSKMSRWFFWQISMLGPFSPQTLVN